MIPLYHDFADETVLVFGGGHVGARKARRFAREARTVVVAPSFPADDYGGAERVRAEPTPDGVDGWIERAAPALAVAATDDDAVNAAVERAARERGVLVNRADRSGGREAGSVVVPATVRDGPVVVAVATGGSSPALSAELRRRIADDIEGAGELAELTAAKRAELAERGVPPERRHEALRAAVASDEVWKVLGSGSAKARRTVDAAVDAALREDP